MTRKRAAAVTGLDIEVYTVGARSFALGLHNGQVFVQAEGRAEHVALDELVRLHYKKTSRKVMEKQGWKCLHCGATAPLQDDHIRPRSQGRSDAEQNQRALCADCHRVRHGDKLYRERKEIDHADEAQVE